jgi:hypothetical protein
MDVLESQEEDVPKCIHFCKHMSWMGKIRSHRRDETWSTSLWQTFFSTSMGAQIPVMVENPFATCGCRKFQLDPIGDHLNTCTTHSGAKKTHDWTVDQIPDLFRTTHKVKTQQVIKSFWENMWHYTPHIPESSPYYSEDIHTKIGITQRSHDPRIL